MKIFSSQHVGNLLAVFFVLGILCVGYILKPVSFTAQRAEAGTADNVSGYAWSENIGWISFNSTNDGSAVSYGVNLDTTNRATGGTGNFSGNAWSENIGWISFNRLDTGTPPFAPFSGATGPIAQVDWATGKVTGWARALSGVGSVGGWDGWIKLSDDSIPVWNGRGVKISGNNFSGLAWGGADGTGIAGVVGWIDFAPTVGGASVGVQVSAPVVLTCTTPNVTTWSSCQSSATCTTPPSKLTGQPGFRTGTCPTPTYTGNVTEACSSATVPCTAPPTVCGNGICEAGETFLKCSKDCKAKVREF